MGLEKAAREGYEGKHLKGILSQFCKKNNLSFPQTILPIRKGPIITIKGRSYQQVNELVLSWDGKETANLKYETHRSSYMDKPPEVKAIPVNDPKHPEITRVFVPSKQKSFKAALGFQRKYTLEGSINGEEVNLKTIMCGGVDITMYTDRRSPRSKSIPKKTIRMDNNKKYWFLIPAA